MRFHLQKFLVLFVIGFWLFSTPEIVDYFVLPVSASINQTVAPQPSNRLVHHLKDESGNIWEIALGTKNESDRQELILRLTGFPFFEIDHAQPLHIATLNGNSFAAKDLYPQDSPALNIAEYNFDEILSELPTDHILDLSCYLTSDRQVNLKLPVNIVREWQEFGKTKLQGGFQHIYDLPTISFLLA